MQRIEHGSATLGGLVVHHAVARKSLQRHTRAEMLASAREQQHTGITALVQTGEHGIQLTPEGAVHGVECFGLVEHQVGDVVDDGELETG